MPRLFISPLYRYRCSFFYLIIIATSAPTSPPDRVDTALVKICVLVILFQRSPGCFSSAVSLSPCFICSDAIRSMFAASSFTEVVSSCKVSARFSRSSIRWVLDFPRWSTSASLTAKSSNPVTPCICWSLPVYRSRTRHISFAKRPAQPRIFDIRNFLRVSSLLF